MEDREPPVDEDGMPLRLSETDFVPGDQPCDHEPVEVGHGMVIGRLSNGNEYVEERCGRCGVLLSGSWTGGVL